MEPSANQHSCICQNCGFTRDHPENEELYQNHFTCICLLFETAAICCFGGYSNLLTHIPAIALYTPVPQYTISQYMEGLFSDGVITTSRSNFMSFAQRCAGMKTWALSTQAFLKSSFLTIVFND